MFLLPRSRILEPDLSYSLGQSRLLGDSFEVLSIWIAVDAEVGVEDSQLILRKGSPHPLCLLLLRTSSSPSSSAAIFSVCTEQ